VTEGKLHTRASEDEEDGSSALTRSTWSPLRKSQSPFFIMLPNYSKS